jgi:FSR family fosmidomycin resistance protein-like MFS transporter
MITNCSDVKRVPTDIKARRRVLGVGSGAHFIHDGFTGILILLLPLWQVEFALTLTQIGIIRSVYSGAMALFQVPAGLFAERWGERLLLGAGTILTGLAYLTLGLSNGYLSLLVLLFFGGLGASVQHPLSSSVISKVYEQGPRRAALGIYNFSGDLGKMVLPFIAAIVIAGFDWRWVSTGAGIIGIFTGILAYILLMIMGEGGGASKSFSSAGANRKIDDRIKDWGIKNSAGFGAISAIGIIDGAGRSGFLTFLPFLLIEKGAEVEIIGLALTLTFIGGATGKFFCGMLAERLGIIRTVILTEAITGFGILALLPLSLYWALALLPLIGIGLNGTSSVLYGTVSDFVRSERRARGFGLFYTLSVGGSALAPLLFGVLSDFTSVTLTLSLVSLLSLSTIPICKLLVKPLSEAQSVSA